MNMNILLGNEELQEPPFIECDSRDCSNCSKSWEEQYNCESKIKMHEYMKHAFGDVSFSSYIHMGIIDDLRMSIFGIKDDKK